MQVIFAFLLFTCFKLKLHLPWVETNRLIRPQNRYLACPNSLLTFRSEEIALFLWIFLCVTTNQYLHKNKKKVKWDLGSCTAHILIVSVNLIVLIYHYKSRKNSVDDLYLKVALLQNETGTRKKKRLGCKLNTFISAISADEILVSNVQMGKRKCQYSRKL